MYQRLDQEYRRHMCSLVRNLGFLLIMLPLEKKKIEIENTVNDFAELVKLNDPDEFIDPSCADNLGKL